MDDRPRQGLSWGKGFGWVLSLAALFFVGRWIVRLDHGVWAQLRALDVANLFWSIVVFQLWFVMRFVGWERISGKFGNQSERHANLRMWTLSELARYVPGNVWSFAARYKGSRSGGSTRSEAFAALVIEALGLIAGATMIVVMASSSLFGYTLWWAIGGLLILAAATPTALRWLAKKMPKLEHLSRLTILETYQILGWYTLVWAVFGVANAILMADFPHFHYSSVIFYGATSVLAWLVGYISFITPMGLGVREVTLARLIQIPGGIVSEGLAALVAIVTRLWLIVSELIFLGLVLIFSSRKRS